MLTVASNSNERNLNINQNLNGFDFNVRTTETNLEGIPAFNFETLLNAGSLTHLILTRNEKGVEKIFVNGELRDSTTLIYGDLSNWDNSYKLAIGNNFLQNKPWMGEIFYLGIYKRELNSVEILHNYNLGESGVTDVHDNLNGLSEEFVLSQNYPNPFNPATTIKYSIPPSNVQSKILPISAQVGIVKLIVYDVLGREVKTLINQVQLPGSYEVNFNGTGLSSGIYYYQLKSGSFIQTKKMILMK